MVTIFKGNKILKRGIIGIDCGLQGCICLMTNTKFRIESMPDRDSPEEIKRIIHEFREIAKKEFGGLYPIVIMEHVEGRGTDSGFTVAKLTFNYGLCYAYCDGFGMKPIRFYPISWKSILGLTIKQSKVLKVQITPAMKKEKTVKFINMLYPWLNFTKPQCDAIALCELGKRFQLGETVLAKKYIEQKKLYEKIMNREKF